MNPESTAAEQLEAPPEVWEGASYPGIEIMFEETKHKYLVNGEKFPSVTTIIDKHVAKPALVKWAENKTLEGVEQMLKSPEGFPVEADRMGKALYAMGLTPDQEKERKGDIGTDTHAALEHFVKTGELFKLDGEVAGARPYRQALARFLMDADPEVRSSEVLVASTRHRFAGRYDLRLALVKPTKLWVAVTQKDSRAEQIVLRPSLGLWDVKTSNNIYPEVGLQLAGYEQGSQECGFAATQIRAAIHLRPDGTYLVHIFATNRGDFNTIAALYHRFLAMNRRRTQMTKRLERAA